MTDLISQLITWLVDFTHALGYPGIFIMMMLESTFIPLPSEVTLLPVGYLIFQGKMNAGIAFFCATAGMLTGSLFNYYLALKLGRAFLVRWGRYVWFSEDKLVHVERFFKDHGSVSTFLGRLVLGVRHFIPFPAGLARMPLGKFCLYTTLGGALWIAILLFVGYHIGNNQELVIQYMPFIKFGALFLVIGAGLYYYLWNGKNNKKQ